MKIIYNITLIYNNGFTEGQNIFNLKYKNIHKLSKIKKLLKLILFYFAKFLFPFLFQKFENFIENKINSFSDNDNDNDFDSNNKEKNLNNLNLSEKILRKILYILKWSIKKGKFFYNFFEFFNFINFLSKGKYPFLINRIFSFDYVINL